MGDQAIDRIVIFDTTLRDGEQAPGASMTVAEKVKLAHKLDKLGVDIMEAGFPVSSPAQFKAVETISNEVENSVVCALGRAKELDIQKAGEALGSREKKRIHTFIATSDVHIAAKFGDAKYGASLDDKRKTVTKMAVDSIKQAATYTSDIEFSAEDAGRTDISYLSEILQAAVEAGATTINIPDTTGFCTPVEYGRLFETIGEVLSDHPNVILSAHCHDDLGLAVANSLAAIEGGARQVECTINGIGERAGNASLEELVMAIRVRKDHYKIDTNINSVMLTSLSKAVSVATGFPVAPNKAIVGRNAFSHEAGIHQDGVLKSRETYEIMRAEDVGQIPEQIRLGRHSGRHGFFSRLDNLGLSYEQEDKTVLYDRFLALADRKKEVQDRDLEHLVRKEEKTDVIPVFELVGMRLLDPKEGKPSAEVTIKNNKTGIVTEKTSTGDGAVGALYKAINYAIGRASKLKDYEIHSAAEGADAIGEVLVKIDEAGTIYTGSASHTDVLEASARAYIAALNERENKIGTQAAVDFATTGVMDSFAGMGDK